MMSAPTPRTWSIYMALTVPPVPTGMKAGVRISPRGMLITPRRALPSVARSLKEKVSAIEFLVVHRRAGCLLVVPARSFFNSAISASRSIPSRSSSIARLRSAKQAGVPVGIEPVAALDGMRIGRTHRLQPTEGRDEHEQRRARQMEIGHQHVGCPETVARGDEDVGRSGPGLDPAVFARGTFQEAQRRRADSHDPPSAFPCCIERDRRLAAHGAGLGMHLVVGGVVGLHRQEGAGADMKRDEAALDTLGIERSKQLRSEMQSSGGCGDRALLPGVDGLVVAAVALVIVALRGDIRRQRNVADGMHCLVEEWAGKVEAEQHLARLALLDQRRVEPAEKAGILVMAEMDAISGRDALTRPHKGLPAVRRHPHMQRGLDLGHRLAAPADAFQLRRNDLGVVEHQHVAVLKQRRQIAHRSIFQALAGPDDQHPGAVARLRRAQRDAPLRQIEVEQIDAHQKSRTSSAPASSNMAPAMRPSEISRTATPRKPTRSTSMPAISWPATRKAISAAAPMRGVRMVESVT